MLSDRMAEILKNSPTYFEDKFNQWFDFGNIPLKSEVYRIPVSACVANNIRGL